MSSFDQITKIREQLSHQIIGQENLITRIMITLLADGHLLVEGAPGLAKTKAISTLSRYIQCQFQRVQFTPDLLPSDITGTDIFRAETGEFSFKAGPIFSQIVLADEINRAPAKVQSALLEAMSERQVTVGNKTYDLPELFMVMATQNPLEQEGTYPLPEAQLDRFLMHVWVDYPNAQAERDILKLIRLEQHKAPLSEVSISTDSIIEARKEVLDVHMAAAVEEYIVQLVMATREPSNYSAELTSALACGVSPRATIALDRCSRAHAWLDGRDFVTPQDVQAIAPDILRHRLWLSFDAQAKGLTSIDVVNMLLDLVPVA
ncbi:MAG: MoxR family ATPase [Saccharospirillaceae bacterium]|nr:MoxR family ATPase [Pseudomonadales bacterium]NRB78258.1 MoxR family ATPase [Saccharospirillaceae bacterium]